MPPGTGMPPLPPGSQGQAAPQMGAPGLMQMAGMQTGQQMQGMPGMGQTAGMSQISETAVRMGAEIDQALKMLAQAIPQLAPWVEKTTLELRYQIGSAINSGAMPQNPMPQDSEQFPDGSGRL